MRLGNSHKLFFVFKAMRWTFGNWKVTLLCAKIEGDVSFLSKRSASVLKPLSICACQWLRVKAKIITFQSDVHFSFWKNHRPKNLSKLVHIVFEKCFSTFLRFRINKWFELIFWLICLFCIYKFTFVQACYQLSKLGNRYVFLLDNIQRSQASCISHQTEIQWGLFFELL